VAVGVVCHATEAQTTEGGFTRSFRLTRNPVGADGGSAAIVEEGRIHLDITLVLAIHSPTLAVADEATRQQAAQRVAEALAGMRVAGGSVMPPLHRAHNTGPHATPRRLRPSLLPWPLHYEAGEHDKAWRRLRQRWLPGFALVGRDDWLAARHAALQAEQPGASLLDAWLEASALVFRPPAAHAEGATKTPWKADPRPGWIVPIPVGYAALSPLHPAGSVAGVRDRSVPFQFVESVYSLGQWLSPHRLNSATELLWWPVYEPATGLYRCHSAYQPPAGEAARSAAVSTAAEMATAVPHEDDPDLIDAYL
jgi:CRISPR-associated protein Csy2